MDRNIQRWSGVDSRGSFSVTMSYLEVAQKT